MCPPPEATSWAYRVQPLGFRKSKELFPIPQIEEPPLSSVSSSKKARRRSGRRHDVWMEANEAIDSLNCFYVCAELPSGAAVEGRHEKPGQRSAAHESVRKHVLRSVALSRPSSVPTAPVAARELLGQRYDGLSALSTFLCKLSTKVREGARIRFQR